MKVWILKCDHTLLVNSHETLKTNHKWNCAWRKISLTWGWVCADKKFLMIPYIQFLVESLLLMLIFSSYSSVLFVPFLRVEVNCQYSTKCSKSLLYKSCGVSKLCTLPICRNSRNVQPRFQKRTAVYWQESGDAICITILGLRVNILWYIAILNVRWYIAICFLNRILGKLLI